MSTPHPTGRLVPAADGLDLVLIRTLPAALQDSWAALTDAELTARWIGRWEGTGAPGGTITVQYAFEEGSPWSEVRIAECEAPHRLRVLTAEDGGGWDLAVDLDEVGDTTALRFVMHGVEASAVGDIGPGWEYYLDQLQAAITGAPLPRFEDYYPAQRDHYVQQLP